MADISAEITIREGGGGGTTGSIAGSIKGLVGTIIKGNIISNLIYNMGKKLVEILKDFPIITSIFKIFKLILMLLLLPLIPILKPVIIALGQLAKKLAGMAIGGASLGDMFKGLFEGLDKILTPVIKDLWENLKQPLFDAFSAFIQGIIALGIPLVVEGFIRLTFELFKNFPNILSAAWEGLKAALGSIIEDIKTNWKQYLIVFLLLILVGVIAGLITLLTGLSLGWAVLLALAIIGLILWLAKWLVGQIPIWFATLKKFGQWIWDTLVSIFTSAFDILKGIGSWVLNFIKGLFGGKKTTGDHQLGGIISNTGLSLLHKGERVVSATESKQASKSINLSVNIDSPTISKPADIKQLVREIEVRLGKDMRRRISYI
jgi:hypothetical protein